MEWIAYEEKCNPVLIRCGIFCIISPDDLPIFVRLSFGLIPVSRIGDKICMVLANDGNTAGPCKTMEPEGVV